jgi:hypothetical protein
MLLGIVAEVEQRRVHPPLEHFLNRAVALLEGREKKTTKQSGLGFRENPNRRFGNDTETALAADQKSVEI